MNPELWKMVCKVMDKILDVPAIERNEKIKALCDGVDGLEDEVRALLAVEEKAQNIFENVKLPDREDLAQTLTVAAPAKQFKQYSKLEKIGAGGMGVVYKARDIRLGREVALKFLSPQLSDDEKSRRRFLTEAKAISKIDHPNVCVILDFGESADNQLYFTMPFYQGKTLKEHIAERPLSIAKVIDVIIQVTRALQATHAHGVIHRDIKPANVLITNEGVVKVLDFGIAKVPDTELTFTGQAIGTVSYMPPEQIHGEPVDNRADIWSVGVMFYELLAAEKPFLGKSNLAISNAITRCDFKPLRDSIPTAPAILDRIVAKTLSANPDGRYQHVDELLTDLEKLQIEMGETERRIPARQISEGRNIRRLATFGAALVVVITAFMIPAFRYTIEDAYDSVVHRTVPVRGVGTDEIRVGMTAAFSGPARELGRSMQVGIEARFSESRGLQGIFQRISHVTGRHRGRQTPTDDVTGVIVQYR